MPWIWILKDENASLGGRINVEYDRAISPPRTSTTATLQAELLFSVAVSKSIAVKLIPIVPPKEKGRIARPQK
jgi:hypothetical protein